MKPRRQSALVILSFFVVFCLAAFTGSQTGSAQKKPVEKASPTPNNELLPVEPARPQAAPTKEPEKPGKSSGVIVADEQQKSGKEVDEKTPVITNTDLITFNVTVTDIYGRFVSGLSKQAFSIFDEKQQQEITFFSDEDSPVSVGGSSVLLARYQVGSNNEMPAARIVAEPTMSAKVRQRERSAATNRWPCGAGSGSNRSAAGSSGSSGNSRGSGLGRSGS